MKGNYYFILNNINNNEKALILLLIKKYFDDEMILNLISKEIKSHKWIIKVKELKLIFISQLKKKRI